MGAILGLFEAVLRLLHFLGGVPLVAAIMGVGLYLTLKSGFLPLRRFGAALRLTLGTPDSLNVLMAVPNLVGVTVLSGLVLRLKRPFWQR